MTVHLFKAWIGHFVKNVRECGLEVSPSCHHLLILDGHGSHVTMDVAKTACIVGLDLLTLPSHHAATGCVVLQTFQTSISLIMGCVGTLQ